MSSVETSVRSDPKTTSASPMGLAVLAIAVPSVNPTTAAGSTVASGRSPSETRNCTWP